MAKFLALCAIGGEKILANELKKLNFNDVAFSTVGQVEFSGDDTSFYKSNLLLRTADRIFLRLGHFKALDFDELFEGVAKINWQDFFRKNTYVVVDKVRCNKSRLHSEVSVQKIVHKAICDKLCRVWKVFSLSERGEPAKVRIYIDKNFVSVLLDLSGDPLYKRGYRSLSGEAPLRETVAAALLQKMLYRRKTPLYDPFCGSGTIAIEALLYAHNVPPGIGRHFAFENLKIFNEADFVKVREAAVGGNSTNYRVRIYALDNNCEAVATAKFHSKRACFVAENALKSIGGEEKLSAINFFEKDFSAASPTDLPELDGDEGIILSNPPYGLRLSDEDGVKEIYEKIPGFLDNFPRWKAGFICANPDFEEETGLEFSGIQPLKSGNLDSAFFFL